MQFILESTGHTLGRQVRMKTPNLAFGYSNLKRRHLGDPGHGIVRRVPAGYQLMPLSAVTGDNCPVSILGSGASLETTMMLFSMLH